MLPSAPVDYARIRGDYEFFLAYSTEIAAQIEALGPHMAWLGRRPKPTRLLDFGCGSGQFTERLLRTAGRPPDGLGLHLVEPVPDHLQEATRRLAPFACRIVAAEALSNGTVSDEAANDGFDLILANHSLYYVADPAATAAALLGRLAAPGGRLIAALLDHDNALARIWKAGFADAKLPFPFALAKDIEAVFRQQG
jgi:SAM-dependent methyltransferase